MTRTAVCCWEIPRPAGENAGLRDDAGEMKLPGFSNCTTTRIALFSCELCGTFLQAKALNREVREGLGKAAKKTETYYFWFAAVIGRSGSAAILFVMHPFTDETRTGEDAEVAALAAREIH
jgi:hypothetical protein